VKAAAVAAWESYQQTGLHATFEEADAWLAELECGQITEPPTCHP
jgi:predicted transcriptional regulator